MPTCFMIQSSFKIQQYFSCAIRSLISVPLFPCLWAFQCFQHAIFSYCFQLVLLCFLFVFLSHASFWSLLSWIRREMLLKKLHVCIFGNHLKIMWLTLRVLSSHLRALKKAVPVTELWFLPLFHLFPPLFLFLGYNFIIYWRCIACGAE